SNREIAPSRRTRAAFVDRFPCNISRFLSGATPVCPSATGPSGWSGDCASLDCLALGKALSVREPEEGSCSRDTCRPLPFASTERSPELHPPARRLPRGTRARELPGE